MKPATKNAGRSTTGEAKVPYYRQAPHVEAAKHLRLTVTRYIGDRASIREVEEAMSWLRDAVRDSKSRGVVAEIEGMSKKGHAAVVQPYTLTRWLDALRGIAVVALVVLGLEPGCDVHDPHVHILDAHAVDAPAPPDACVNLLDAGPPDVDCCALLPDQDAVRACGRPPPGVCGVVVCHLHDCSVLALDVCGPQLDAGGDAGSDGAP